MDIKEIRWDGLTITEPGIYTGIDIEIYHANGHWVEHGEVKIWVDLFDGPSLSSTGIKELIKRPSLYWAYSTYNPDRFDRPEKQHFIFGKAAHALLLGDEDFNAGYAVRPEQVWSEKSNKLVNWSKVQPAAIKFMEENEGKSLITGEDLNIIAQIAESMRRNEAITKGGLLNGKVERTAVAKIDGIWIKARPDNLPITSGDITDLKTAAAIDPDSLERATYNAGYYIQGGLNRVVFSELMGPEWFNSFSFAFVEKDVPYDVVLMQLGDDELDLGEQQVREAIKVFNHCWDTNNWYGYDGPEQHIEYLHVPAWAEKKIKTQLELSKLLRKNK